MGADVTIRNGTADDFAAIAALRAAWGGERNDITDDPQYTDQALAWLDRESTSRRYWVALVDGEVVGFVTLAVNERMPWPGLDGGRWGYLNHMYARADRRQHGIGQRLLDAVIEHSRAERFDRLLVNPSARSVSLYERGGFATPETLLVLQLEARVAPRRSHPRCRTGP